MGRNNKVGSIRGAGEHERRLLHNASPVMTTGGYSSTPPIASASPAGVVVVVVVVAVAGVAGVERRQSANLAPGINL